jgi:hypothetical protein
MREGTKIYPERTITPKITERQANHIEKMFKTGKFLPAVLSYLDYDYEQHRDKQDANYKHCDFSRWDAVYTEIMAKAAIWSETYWIEQQGEMDNKNWQFIMKNKFGWSSNPPYRGEKHNSSALKLEESKPVKILDAIIEQTVSGEMSVEKGKGLTEMVVNSYAVRSVTTEGEKSD